jgi:hypothetical protein
VFRASYFKKLATNLRISSAEIFATVTEDSDLPSFFSLESSLLSWREVLPPRPCRPPNPMTNDSLNTRTCDTQLLVMCFWAG